MADQKQVISRRQLLSCTAASLSLPLVGCDSATRSAADEVFITEFELIPVRATERTVWLILRLHTNMGLSGIGEASNAFGSANTSAANVATMRAAIAEYLKLFTELSPLAVPLFRQRAKTGAQTSLITATAFSAIEQAMWDLAGQLFSMPTWKLFGSKVRDALPVYANINRAVEPRTPVGFASIAKQARDSGFRAVKAAPFDNYPLSGTASEIAAHVETGIQSTFAMREAIGDETALMIDCHSFFSAAQAIEVAKELESANLAWFEEPVTPTLVDESVSIRESISQPTAGGELLFGVTGFRELIQRRAFDVIMPDVKHCGGLTEILQIAAMADEAGIAVAPHNPSGPVSTAASIQVSAVMANLNYLELQYGEVDWRGDILSPAEAFVDGRIAVPDAPGFGVTLDDAAIEEFSLD